MRIFALSVSFQLNVLWKLQDYSYIEGMEDRKKRRYCLSLTADQMPFFNAALPEKTRIVETRYDDGVILVNIETSITRSQLVNFVYSLPNFEHTLYMLFLLFNTVDRNRKNSIH